MEGQKAFGKSLNGVGFFTLDGVVATPDGQPARYWRKALLDLNATWAHIPNHAVPMPSPSPSPSPKGSGSCTKTAPTNACGSCSTENDCGNDSTQSMCWAAKDWQCPQE